MREKVQRVPFPTTRTIAISPSSGGPGRSRTALHDGVELRRELTGTLQDASDRQCADAAVEESENRFRTLCESSLAGIYIVQDGCIKYANPALARILGHEPDELNGVSPLAFFHADDQAIVAEHMRRRLRVKRKQAGMRHVVCARMERSSTSRCWDRESTTVVNRH